jgi:integrase
MAAEPIRDKNQVKKLAGCWPLKGQLRNYVLVLMGMRAALRISGLLRLKWDDVHDFERMRVRRSMAIIERKTSKIKAIALNAGVAEALKSYAAAAAKRGARLVVNRKTNMAISRVQAHRAIRGAAEPLQLDQRASCRPLRRTFGCFSWKSGIPPVILMEIYNHSSMAAARRRLGAAQDDIDEAYRLMAQIA